MPKPTSTPSRRDSNQTASGKPGAVQRSVATDLGVGLSTLSRWIREDQERRSGSSRQTEQPDLAAELKRLRRENDILRQERDILKRATAFFAREGSR
jgi:transposase